MDPLEVVQPFLRRARRSLLLWSRQMVQVRPDLPGGFHPWGGGRSCPGPPGGVVRRRLNGLGDFQGWGAGRTVSQMGNRVSQVGNRIKQTKQGSSARNQMVLMGVRLESPPATQMGGSPLRPAQMGKVTQLLTQDPSPRTPGRGLEPAKVKSRLKIA